MFCKEKNFDGAYDPDEDKNEIGDHSGEYSQDLLKFPQNLCPLPIVRPDSQCVEIWGHNEVFTSCQCIGDLHFILFCRSTWSSLSDVGNSIGNLHCLVDISDPELGFLHFPD